MAAVTLRSAEWYSGDVRTAYIHRAWMRGGIPDDAFDRPQIAIADTASGLTVMGSPCAASDALTRTVDFLRQQLSERDRT
jgi:dihydroxyacid dehydratase/phosphogluconate dehydratase